MPIQHPSLPFCVMKRYIRKDPEVIQEIFISLNDMAQFDLHFVWNHLIILVYKDDGFGS